jgi:hypothetical protein
MSPPLFDAIFKNDLVNDLSTKDASPSEKFFAYAVEFFEDHDPTATFALHINLLSVVKPHAIKAWLPGNRM